MSERYNLSWLHDDAKRLGYGKLTLEMVVYAGQIVRIDKVQETKSVGLKESHKVLDTSAPSG